MGAFIWPLLILILSRKIGYTTTDIAKISVVIGVIFIPSNLLGGKLADHFSKKKIIAVFDVISASCFFICSQIEPGNGMMILFVIAGLFATMEAPAYNALLMELSKPAEREKAYSLNYLGHNLGFMVGAAVGGLLFENYLHIAFIIDGLTTLMSTLLIVLFVKSVNVADLKQEEINVYEANNLDDKNIWSILGKRKPLFVQLMVFMLAAFVYEQWSFTLPLYIANIYQAQGAKYFGLLASFNGAVVIVFTPVFTWMLVRLTDARKIVLGGALLAFSYGILLLPTSLAFMFLMMLVFTWGEIINMLGSAPFVSRRIPAAYRGRYTGLREVAYMIGATAGRLFAGWALMKYSYDHVFGAVILVGVVGTVLAMINTGLDRRRFPGLYAKKSNSA
jgi:predicted MFS family arabinose efflux permease